MARLGILCSDLLNLSNEITKIKIGKNIKKIILSPIKHFLNYFLAHQYMSKILHDLCKAPSRAPPSYIQNA